jgi:hypothetical protein
VIARRVARIITSLTFSASFRLAGGLVTGRSPTSFVCDHHGRSSLRGPPCSHRLPPCLPCLPNGSAAVTTPGSDVALAVAVTSRTWTPCLPCPKSIMMPRLRRMLPRNEGTPWTGRPVQWPEPVIPPRSCHRISEQAMVGLVPGPDRHIIDSTKTNTLPVRDT